MDVVMRDKDELTMMLSSVSFAIISCVAVAGASLLWSRKRRTPGERQHPGEIATSLISFSQARPSLELGMEHARRLEYNLAIIVIQELDQAAPGMAAANDEPGTRKEDERLETRTNGVLRNTSLLRKVLRMTDIEAYNEDGQFVVIMLPGIDNVGATHTIQRIRKQLDLESGSDVQTGCAEFPGDGLLLDDLVSIASSRMAQSETVVRIHPETRLNATKQ